MNVKLENVERVFEKEIDKIEDLVERLDFLDVIILKKFYLTGKEFPSDTEPYCFPILFYEMKKKHKMKIGREALRKRLDNLTKLGLLEKIKNSNPSNYLPIPEKKRFVKMLIKKFLLLAGFSQIF